jgi:HK97 family phage prohead protease
MADPIRKILGGAILKDGSLNDREIRVIASDATVDRAGDVVEPSGCRLAAFAKNPIVLANHNPEHPIGTAQANFQNNRVEALITFAPRGLSKLADEWCGLAKAKILNAISIGFNPIEYEPIGRGGTRFTEWELLELSIVSVPANPNAVVIARDATAGRKPSSAATRHQRSHQPDDPAVVARNHQEYKLRQACRAAGIVELTFEEWNKFLAREFPGIDSYEARAAYRARQDNYTLHQRFMEQVRRSEFAKEIRRPPPVVSSERKEAEPRFWWDPNVDAATNCFNLRCFEMRGGRFS